MTTIRIRSKNYGYCDILVDDEDYNKVRTKKWHITKGTKTLYVYSTNHDRTQLELGHFILNTEKIVDHIDGNGLNNTKGNLRECSKAENNRNTRLSKNNKSGFKGVSYDKARNKYVARIWFNWNQIPLGRFNTALEAAVAYNNAAIKYHGKFAKLNEVVGPSVQFTKPCRPHWNRIVSYDWSRVTTTHAI